MKDARPGREGPSDLTEPRDATDNRVNPLVTNRVEDGRSRLPRVLPDIDENELIPVLRAPQIRLRHLHGFEE